MKFLFISLVPGLLLLFSATGITAEDPFADGVATYLDGLVSGIPVEGTAQALSIRFIIPDLDETPVVQSILSLYQQQGEKAGFKDYQNAIQDKEGYVIGYSEIEMAFQESPTGFISERVESRCDPLLVEYAASVQGIVAVADYPHVVNRIPSEVTEISTRMIHYRIDPDRVEIHPGGSNYTPLSLSELNPLLGNTRLIDKIRMTEKQGTLDARETREQGSIQFAWDYDPLMVQLELSPLGEIYVPTCLDEQLDDSQVIHSTTHYYHYEVISGIPCPRVIIQLSENPYDGWGMEHRGGVCIILQSFALGKVEDALFEYEPPADRQILDMRAHPDERKQPEE